MEDVAVARCVEYNSNLVKEKINTIVDLIGGFESFINRGDKVVLKVNLLRGSSPEKAVTTHPVLVEEIARKVKEIGAEPIIADSPGGPFTTLNLKQAYYRSGFIEVAKNTGAILNYNTDSKKIEYPEGEIGLYFELAEYILDADKIINLPKLKTHGLTKYTGAVKNLFGTVPGLIKAEYHLKMDKVDIFSKMLVDLAEMLNPVLNIMDGIIGMEGEGPSGGKPRQFGYLLASTSPFALDVAGSKLLGINNTKQVPTINEAYERNLVADISDIQLLGNELVSPENTDIPKIERQSNLLDQRLPDWLSRLVARYLRPRPEFNLDKCVGCGDCVLNCPSDALKMKENFPELDLENCIRCFCCQELCSKEAVSIKRPLLGKILFT